MGLIYKYIGRQYLFALVALSFLLLSLIYFLELAELFRRTADKIVGFEMVMLMGLTKLPQTGQVMLPFIVLFAGVFTLWRLTRRQEIVIARAAGLSVWQFTSPLVLGVLIFGIVNVTLLGPVSARLLQEYKSLETRYIAGASTLDLTGAGLWVRQPYERGTIVIHAPRVNKSGKELAVHDAIALFFDKNEKYLGRIDASGVVLRKGHWLFTNAIERMRDAEPVSQRRISIPTDLTRGKIEESLSQPDTISFWDLPSFIGALEKTGFSAARHLQHYYALMAQPLLLVVMALLAVIFMQRQTRSGGGLILLVGATLTGTGIFILNNTVLAMGITGAMPALLAAWAVPVAGVALALTALLHLEGA